ncbi:UNVERIFIED_CONTAM: Retrovirus-related Pol polyprotein from transposon RE1 [Sesamum radiatum]|uniref:Retrovirus-related Pol polyprotein from transposon RE1 n=1 Tax=Sesamum radiatum TaxID=300843 RepID=A0AAW2NPM6_SESRA
MKIALRAKMKLGYITGSNPKPAEDSEEYEQWVRTDSLVISWILNTISKEIVESFLYIDTARELWLEIEARYGVSNGPLVYQLQREIASASQGTLSVSAYFAKLKKLWDELGCLRKTPSCSCGALKELAEMKETDHLMQFLMGLNDTFEGIRGQILMLEPLPTVTKAYATILREERQREVSSTLSSSLQNVAMQVRGFQTGKDIEVKNQWKKRTAQEKKGQLCTHCRKSGHLKESCFEILGYPDWYKVLVEQKKKTGNSSNRVLNVAETAQSTLDEQAVAEIIRGEFQKFMEGVAPGTFERTRSDEFEDFADDHSRSTWTYLMKYKSQAVSVLKAFHRMIFTQFGKRIKTIRSDNGTEFLSLECQNFMIEEGIVHQRTCTHTPQQNGVVEIKHKHLLQIARALMFQSNMPAMFWSEALLTATYIINRLPTHVLNWKSPFEVLRKRTPEYTHMRVFGSLCFATNVQPHKRKFDYRAIKAVFLGYATGQKGYRLYDFNTHSLIVSRDVVFHEDVFPYAQKQLDPVTCTLPMNLDDVDDLSSKTQGLEEDNHDTVSEELHVTPQEPEACTEPIIRRNLGAISKLTNYQSGEKQCRLN